MWQLLKIIEDYFQYLFIGALGMAALTRAQSPQEIMRTLLSFGKSGGNSEGTRVTDESSDSSHFHLGSFIICSIALGLILDAMSYRIFQTAHIKLISKLEERCAPASASAKTSANTSNATSPPLLTSLQSEILTCYKPGAKWEDEKKRAEIKWQTIQPSVFDIFLPIPSIIYTFQNTPEENFHYQSHLNRQVSVEIDEKEKFHVMFDTLDKSISITQGSLIACIAYFISTLLNIRKVKWKSVAPVTLTVLIYLILFQSYWSLEIRYHQKASAAHDWNAQNHAKDASKQKSEKS